MRGGGFGAAADGIAEILGLPPGESLDGPKPAVGWREGTRRLWDALAASVPEQAVLEKWREGVPSSQELHYEGVRAEADSVAGVKGAYENFLENMPPYPGEGAGNRTAGAGAGAGDPAYQGRGVVITGGVVKYWSSAVLAFAAVRRSGCNIPGELWILESEVPSIPSEAREALSRIGVEVHVLPHDPDHMLSGYRTKVAALLSSSFEEVLFLDSDSIALQNVCELFEHPTYKKHGAIFWPDLWPPTPSPELFEVTGLSPDAGLQMTHETGQMVISKKRHWRPLMLATHFNLLGPGLYYRFLSDINGEGDKESFPFGFVLSNETYHLVPGQPDMVGVHSEVVENDWYLYGLIQRWPDGGQPTFLHANGFKPSYLNLPDHVPTKGHPSKYASHHKEMLNAAGFDIEIFMFKVLRTIRCDVDIIRFTLTAEWRKYKDWCNYMVSWRTLDLLACRPRWKKTLGIPH